MTAAPVPAAVPAPAAAPALAVPPAAPHAGAALRDIVGAARRLADDGHDVLRLDIGEPDARTAAHIVDAGVRALRDGATTYVAAAGIPPLRAAIAHAARARGIAATADQVVVTAGAKPMLLYALLALLRRGDGVLVPDPGYPGYTAAVRLAGGRPVSYPLVHTAAGFRLDHDALRAAAVAAPGVRVLVVNSPHNPTGAVLDDADLAAVADVALAHDLWIVSDEVYAALTYDGAVARSIATLPGLADRTIVVDSFSKTYAMTGWRLGYGIVPAALAAPLTALVADSATCAPPFVQAAGVAALTGPQDAVAAMRAEYAHRRDLLAAALGGVPGITAPRPGGAFYLFARVDGLLTHHEGGTTDALAHRLLHTHGVACIPGSAFGPRGAAHLRLSFAAPRGPLLEAARRIAACARGHR